MFYECMPIPQVSYPPEGCRPPKLYKYPEGKPPVKLLFLGWNPPKPFGGFWSVKSEDNLRSELHAVLSSKKLNQINASFPDKTFLNEFLEKGFYFIHTVKCYTESKFPGFSRGSATTNKEKDKGKALIASCVRTHLEFELKTLEPQKVCVLGKVPFLGLCELFPELTKIRATPTQGKIFQPGDLGMPWHLCYTCFPKLRRHIVIDHLQAFLQSH